MKYLITLTLVLVYINTCFTQETIDIDESTKIEENDTLIAPVKATIMSSRNTWTYAENDSILQLLNIDTLKSYTQIKNNIVSSIDDIDIFEEKWDTINIFAHGYMNFKESLDTVAIPLLTSDSSKFVVPINVNKVCCGFGWRRGRLHCGVDLNLKTGDTLVAAFDGIVRYARWNRGGYGYLVIIRHTNGLESYYAHLSKLSCKSNQIVKAGDAIGLGGNTGRSSGPHLHFELRHKDTPFNPEAIIDFAEGKLKSDILYFIPDNFKKGNNNALANTDYHIINKGDTLWNISRKYKIPLKQLCSLNGIKEQSTLSIGQKIKLR